MTTCQDIVRRALRLAAGETGSPTGADAEDAMQRLQSIILGLPGFIHNGQWCDRYVSTVAQVAGEGERITITSPGTISFPATISCYGERRQPLDLAKVHVIGGVNAGFWLYSATKAAWGRADGLTISSDIPFGPEDDEGLAALLAVALVDEYGGEVSAATVSTSNRANASFRSRFKKRAHQPRGFRDYV